MTMIDRYRRWLEYERDSHSKVLASLENVPAELRGRPSFSRALELLGHIVAARRLWLFRLGASGERPTVFFPKDVGLPELTRQVGRMEEDWEGYLTGLTDTDLAHPFEYRSTEGVRYRNTIEDILTQLFGHSWYHRGQIALLVRSMDVEPAATDFVFWTRDAIPEEPAAL